MKKLFSKIRLPKSKLPRPKLLKPKMPGSGFQVPGISPALGLGEALISKVAGVATGGYGLVRSTIGGIPFFGNTANSKSYDHTKYDERHYFLVPDLGEEDNYSLYVMRCLPDGVPPVNNFPKRRILHLPSEHALPQLEAVVLEAASEDIKNKPREPGYLSANISALLDEIDKVDETAFKGLLLVGGLVALVNPLAGAAVAAKAALPAIGMVLGRYGVKYAEDAATNMDIARQIKRAHKDLKKEFSQSGTFQLINPLLGNLGEEPKLEAWMMEKNKYQFTCSELEFSQADLVRLMELTQQAVDDTTDYAVSEAYFKTMRKLILWG